MQELGYHVLTAARAEDALAMIQAGAKLDLLLTDVLLPGVNGPELYRRLTALRRGPGGLHVGICR